MPNFMFAFHGGTEPQSPEEGQKIMSDWMAWMGKIEKSIVDGGNPVGMSKTVSADGVADNGGSNPLSGYTVVSADTIEAACEMAKGCPILNMKDGSVEVAEIHEIEM